MRRIVVASAIVVVSLILLVQPALIVHSQGPKPDITDFTQHPAHGPDRTSQEMTSPEVRLSKGVMGAMASEWTNIVRLDTLSVDELAKIDGVVHSQAYWAVLDDAQVKGQVVAELARANSAGAPTALGTSSTMTLQAAANQQTLSAIVELTASPDADQIAAISSRVKRVRHVFEIIDAVAVDLTPAQLAAVAQLPFVRYLWPDAPVKEQLQESVPQIGANTIHTLGVTGQGVKVAVVDRGLQDDHPEYEGRVVAERYNKDDNDHATHVAGIIAANWTQTGVAPDALLLDAVFDKDEDLTGSALWSDVIAAIEWAANQGADVINASLGAPLWQYPRDGSSIVDTAVDNVITQYGIPVVVSAGNEAERHDTGTAEGHPTPGGVNRYWHSLNVGSAEEGLRITLWWDYGNNDLDLELLAPDGTVVQSQTTQPGGETPYHPDIYYEKVEFSQAQVEQQIQTYGTDAVWWVRVVAAYGDVPDGPQDYHVAIDIGDASFTSPNPVDTVMVPATARQALAVGSVKDGSTDTIPPATPVNERSAFSSQGPTAYDFQMGYHRIKPEIMAPGEKIESASVSNYKNLSGTSQAAPHVAGAMALLLEAAGKRLDGSWLLNQQELRGTIIDTAQDLDGDAKIDNLTGAGLVKPTNAVFTGTITHQANRYFKVTPQYPTATYPGVTGQVLSFDWQSVTCRWSSGSNDLDLYLYRLDNGAEVASATTTNPTYDKIDGDGIAPDDYNYVLRVFGWDVTGSEAFIGVSTNNIQPVAPPALSVQADASNPNAVDKGQTFTVHFNVNNSGGLPALSTVATLNLPSGVELVSGSNPQLLGAVQPGGQATATWQVRGLTSGDKNFTVEASSQSWGATWSHSGADSVYIRPMIGPLVYDSHTIDDDSSGNSSGNGDGLVNCGETIELFVNLRNQGSDPATGINATLSTSDAYVTWPLNTGSSYADLEGSQVGANLDDFEMQVASNTPDGHVIHLNLNITASQGGPWSDSFDLSVTCNHAPNTPNTPTPGHNAAGVAVTTNLSWNGGDPDAGDTVTYDVYFEANNSNPTTLICNDISTTTCDPPGNLSYNTDYYWKVVATDNHNASTTGSVWHFTTANNPPYTPNNPLPAHHATGVSISTNLSWAGGDPDAGDTVTYDVYLEANNSNPTTLICNDISTTTCDPLGSLSYSTDYYWKVVATDNHNDSATGSVWHFTTGSSPNNPPNTPYNPIPIHNATGVAIDAILGWAGGDPDVGDTVTYDVYFEANNSNPTTLICNDTAGTTCDPPGNMAYSTDYYWKVIATDNHGASATAGVWHFSTTSEPNNSPNTPGSPSPGHNATGVAVTIALSWSGGDPDAGDTVTYDVYLEANNSNPTSLICNDVSATACDPPGNLAYNTSYYWKVVATDNHNASTTSSIWHFTTVSPNVGPLVYHSYTADDDNNGQSSGNNDGVVHCGETIELFVTLHNQGSDTATGVAATISTGDSYVTWLYNTTSSYPDLSGGGIGANTDDFDFQVASNTPNGHTIHFNLNMSAASGGPWSDSFDVTVSCNSPPNIPSAPSPADGATNQDRNVDLSWSGGDPDAGDTVIYDVYLEANSSFPTVRVCDDITTTTCDPGLLGYSTHYYWYVIAYDNHGAYRVGDIWEFTTAMQTTTGPVVHDSHTIDDDNIGQSFGNDDGLIHCGESIETLVTLRNQDTNNALYVTGSISTTDPYVTWLDNTSSPYPHIWGGGTAVNNDDFEFQVDSDTPDGHIITFKVDITASNGGPWTDTFTEAVTCGNPSGVVINEIYYDCDGYCPNPVWIELYNAGSQAVDMTGWHFYAYNHNNVREVDYYSSFSGFVLQPDHYVVLHEGYETNTSTDLYLGYQDISWDFYHSRGAAALVDDSGAGVDFVRWQGSGVNPPPGTTWHGDIPTAPPANQTLARDQFSTDTDHADDWTIQPPSQGAVNLGTNTCYSLTRLHYGAGIDPQPSPTNSPGCGFSQYIPGTQVELTADPVDSKWWIANWIGTGQDTSTAATNSLTMPAGNHTVGVNYETGHIVINEVNLGPATEESIELYNAGSEPINMTGWKLKTYSLNYDGSYDTYHTYTFPSYPTDFILQPGAYVVIHDYGLTSFNSEADLYLGNKFVYWFPGDGGAVELRTSSASTSGVDFVRWGDSIAIPPVPTGWTGPDPASPPYGQNLGRNQLSTDTDSGSDWQAQQASLHGQNLCHTLTLTHTGTGGSDPVPSNTHSTGCPTGQYVMGAVIALVANPGSGWYVARWSGTDDDSSTSTNNILTMPDEEHTVTVSYVEDTIPGPIVINELAPDASDDWIELYNAGSQAVDMTGWRFLAYDHMANVDADYTFPTFTLLPGDYVVLHEGSGTNTATDLYMAQSIWYYAGSDGAAALLTAGGSGVDFVRWRNSPVEPPPGTTWTNDIPWWAASGQTIGRDRLSTDTDDAGDWTVQDPTPGKQNLSGDDDGGGDDDIQVYLPVVVKN